MRIVAISDCRMTTAEQINKLCEKERPDLLLYAGDDVARFGPVPDEVYIDAGVQHLRSLAGEVPKAGGLFRAHRWGVPDKFERTDGFSFGALLSAHVHARAVDVVGRHTEPGQAVHAIGGREWAFSVTRWMYQPAMDWSPLADRIPNGIAGVLGNDCLPADGWVLQRPGCHDLHAGPLLLPGLAIVGLAGAPLQDGEGRGYLLYDEAAAAQHLAEQLAACEGRDVILVSHAPPFEILDLAIRYGANNIGSRAVRDIVEAGKVSLVVCGHVHRQGGSTRLVGADCAVVNVASHDNEHAALRYAVIEARPGDFDITHHEIRNDDLYQISGVGPSIALKIRAAGICDVVQLAGADPATLGELLGPNRGPQMQAHARSLLSGAPVLIDEHPTISESVIYLDVETSHKYHDDPWLVGMLFPDGQFEQLHELALDRHPEHLRALDARLQNWPDHTFIQWGSFDRTALKRAYGRCGLPLPAWLAKSRWIDARIWLKRHIALPLRSLKLKDVCRYFAYEVRHPHLDGMTVGAWYSRYRDEGIEFEVGEVLEYNEDDVRSLMHVVAAVCRLSAGET